MLSLGAMTTSTRAGRETARAGNAELKTTFGPPSKRGQAILGGSYMHFRGDASLGGNLAAQANPSPDTTVAARVTLNSKGAGGVTLHITSHDNAAKYGLSLLVPLLGMLADRVRAKLGRGGGGGGGGMMVGDGEGEGEGEEGVEEEEEGAESEYEDGEGEEGEEEDEY